MLDEYIGTARGCGVLLGAAWLCAGWLAGSSGSGDGVCTTTSEGVYERMAARACSIATCIGSALLGRLEGTGSTVRDEMSNVMRGRCDGDKTYEVCWSAGQRVLHRLL